MNYEKEEDEKEEIKNEIKENLNRKDYRFELFCGLLIILIIEIYGKWSNILGSSNILKGGNINQVEGKVDNDPSKKRKKGKVIKTIGKGAATGAKLAGKGTVKGAQALSRGMNSAAKSLPDMGSSLNSMRQFILIGGIIIGGLIFLVMFSLPSIMIIGIIIMSYFFLKEQIPIFLKKLQ